MGGGGGGGGGGGALLWKSIRIYMIFHNAPMIELINNFGGV